MKKLSKKQKDLVLKSLEESGDFPGLVEKAKKDPDAEINDKEWNQARKKVVSNMLRSSDSRYFKVAPYLKDEATPRSKNVEWLFDHREGVGFVLIVLGVALMLLDPGSFAERGDPPEIESFLDNLSLVQYLFNWGFLGWSGLVSAVMGYLWSRYPQLFID